MTSKKIPFVPFALLVCVVYWLYLIMTAQAILVYDALGYSQMGALIQKKGWLAYFHTLGREPLYSLFTSIAMTIGSCFGIFWQDVLKSLHFSLLLLTQLLMWFLLRRLKIREEISAVVLLYFGFSPAVINAACSMYSEVLTFPLMAGIIVLSLKTWQSAQQGEKTAWVWAGALGYNFVLLTFVKGIFEYIFPIFLTIFFFKAFFAFRKSPQFKTWVTVILVLVTIFYTAVLTYKYINYRCNGNFTMSAQSQFGSWNFYGNAVRRSQVLTDVERMAALSAVPGEEFCEKIYGDTCSLWSLMKSDEIAVAKRNELIFAGHTSIDKKAFSLSFEHIAKNPLQYLGLTFLEGSKMIFWESTHIGFVAYPDWLSHIYDNIIFAWGLTIMVGLITLASLISVVLFMIKKVKGIFIDQYPVEDSVMILFFSLFLIVPFVGSYAILFIIKRYLFPLVPLYIIFIAFFITEVFRRFNTLQNNHVKYPGHGGGFGGEIPNSDY